MKKLIQEETEETVSDTRKHRKKAILSAAVIAGILLLCAAGLLAVMMRQISPVTTDLDQPVRIPLLEHPFLSRFCCLEPGSSLPDTSEAKETEVTVRLLGLFPRRIPVVIRDMTPPEVTAREVTVFQNTEVLPEEFIRSAEDRTALTFRFIREPDPAAPGDVSVDLGIRDEGGNVTLRKTVLHILPEEEIPRVEFGSGPDELRKTVEKQFPEFQDFDYTAVDLKKCGRYPVEAFRGDEPGHFLVIVEDTTPPEGSLRQLDLRVGQSLTPEDLVETVSDQSPVQTAFAAVPDLDHSGVQTVSVKFTDEQGNSAEVSTELRVWQLPETFVIETGLTTENFVHVLLDPAMPADAGVPSLRLENGFHTEGLSLGEHPLTLHGEFNDFSLLLTVEDTVPPTGEPAPHDLLLGETLPADELVRDIDDVSEVGIAYAAEPDFGKPGRQEVTVLLTDSQNNSSEVKSELMIWDIPSSVTMEYGTKTEAFLSDLFGRLGKQTPPKVESGFRAEQLQPGTDALTLHGKYEDLTVSLKTVDTTPPQLSVKPVTVYIGTPVSVRDFVVSADDLSEITLSLERTPDLTYAHKENVTVRAVDAWNNETALTAELSVLKDETPPVIYGVQDLSATEGETLSFRRNVYAVDDRDGDVSVTVDSSGVNTKAAGTYTVVYRASDSSGNLAEKRALVTIRSIDMESVNRCADQILGWLITPGASQYEKARAIYNWCTANITYSTSTSYLMGQFAKAAYSGMTTGAGNCYVYYAVASALMTRCGLENQMIQRNSTTNPHYWNLVKVDGNWYHFDACPHHAGCEIVSFLLTDSEVADYSTYVDPGYYSFDSSLYPATP